MGGLNVQYPNVSEGPPESQIQQIKDYLYQLTDQLNLQDNSAEKMFEEVSKAIDAEAVADGSNEQLSKLKEYANLKALIIKTGDYATSHSEEFKKILKSEFSAISDFGEFSEELVQQVTENSSGIERLFDYTAGINNADAEWAVGTQQFIKTGLLYYDEGQVPVFGVGVGVISTIVAQDETVVDMEANQLATFTADEIAFWDNGNKVAYIRDNAINFPSANIRGGSIHIGEEENNFFKVDTSGNLQVGDFFQVTNAGLATMKSADERFVLDLSAGNIVLTEEDSKITLGNGIITLRYGENITGVIRGHIVEEGPDGDTVIGVDSRAQFQNFDAIDTDGVVSGTFNNSGLKVSTIQLRDRYDAADVTGSFVYNESQGKCILNSDEYTLSPVGYEGLFAKIGFYGSRGGYLNLYSSTYSPTIVLENTALGGSLDISSTEGKVVSLKATEQGSSFSLGNVNDGLWTIAEYDNEGRHVHADHFHFHNKTDGLITGTVAVSQCSAYIVIGQPTSGGYYSTAVIPSAIATGRTWQIADENNYIKFTISSNGTVSETGGSSGSGSLTAAYSIR